MFSKKAFKSTFAMFILMLLSFPLCASAKYSRSIRYENTRSLAMGGTSVATSNDQQAIFSNPAGLGNRKTSAYSVINLNAERNLEFDEINNSISSLSNADTQSSRINNNKEISSAMGKIGYQAFSNLAYYLGADGFSAAVLYKNTEMYEIANPSNPILTSKVDKDVILTGSLARPFKERQNIFRDLATGWWGSTIKFVSKNSADKLFYAKDFAAIDESSVKDTTEAGVAFDFDLGALWQLTNPWQASFGVFAGNVLESEISPEAGSLHRQLALGFAIKPLSGPPERSDKLLLAADYWDVDGKGTFMTNLRLGMEAKFSEIVKLQIGFRSGYPTAGITMHWGDARLEAATYAEELGVHPGDLEDRRYSLSMGFEF